MRSLGLARTAILVIVLAVLVAMLFAALTTPPRCQSIDAERVSVEKLETLRDEGWYSDPTNAFTLRGAHRQDRV